MKTMISISKLKEIAKQVEAHNEVLEGMRAVSMRLHYSAVRIGEKLGAVAYSGSVASGWIRFLLKDGTVVFGTISYPSEKSDIIANVSDINVFAGIGSEVGFQHAEQKWRDYFKVPSIESEENFKSYTIL